MKYLQQHILSVAIALLIVKNGSGQRYKAAEQKQAINGICLTPVAAKKLNGIAIGESAGRRTDEKLSINGMSIQLGGQGFVASIFWPIMLVYGERDFLDADSIANADMNGFSFSICGEIFYKMNGLNISGLVSSAHSIHGLSVTGVYSSTKSFKGVCISGLINTAGRGIGLQIGVINLCKNLKGLQIGLWNYNGKRGLPFINWRT